MRVLLDHPDVAARWGAAGRAHVIAHRSWEDAGRSLVAVHERVATLGRRGEGGLCAR
ncbi:MAG: hypothetical protein ABIS47_05205 [Acidimicrobiales bacterium]